MVKGLAELLRMLGARCRARFRALLSAVTAATSPAEPSSRLRWDRGYRAQSKGERGRGGVGAHSGAVEEVSELGEGLVTTGGRRRSRWPEEEEDVGDGAPRLPASHGLVETKKKARRFFWRHRRGEGWPVAAANSVGGDGCARHERERETEEGESSGESEGRSGRPRVDVQGVQSVGGER